MINLLPPNAKRDLVWEYWTRVLTVWSVLGIAVVVLLCATLVPTYVLLSRQLEIAATAQQDLQAQATENARVRGEVREANAIAAVLLQDRTATKFSSVIAAIDAVAGSDIFVRTYTLGRTDGVIDTVQIRGVAVSRSALAAFGQALEAQPQFASAEVPISDLVRETDLPFTITIVMTQVN